MGGYIDLTPHRLRQLAELLKNDGGNSKVLRDAADCMVSAANRIESDEEVLDGLASREREKLQQEMAALRAELVRERADAARYRKLADLAVYCGTYNGEHVWRFRPIMTPHLNLNDAIDGMGGEHEHTRLDEPRASDAQSTAACSRRAERVGVGVGGRTHSAASRLEDVLGIDAIEVVQCSVPDGSRRPRWVCPQ